MVILNTRYQLSTGFSFSFLENKHVPHSETTSFYLNNRGVLIFLLTQNSNSVKSHFTLIHWNFYTMWILSAWQIFVFENNLMTWMCWFVKHKKKLISWELLAFLYQNVRLFSVQFSGVYYDLFESDTFIKHKVIFINLQLQWKHFGIFLKQNKKIENEIVFSISQITDWTDMKKCQTKNKKTSTH